MYRLLDKISSKRKTANLSSINKILILRPDRLGDVLLTFPAVYNLHVAFPNAELYYLCRAYTAPIVQCYTPVSDTIIYPDTTGKEELRSLAREISGMEFDLAVHLLPKAILARTTYAAGIPYRLGMGYRLYSIFYNLRQFEHRKYNEYHEAEYNLHMLKLLGIRSDYDERTYQQFKFPPSSETAVDKLISKAFGKERFIVIHPGSGGSSIDWPVENFLTLMEILEKWRKIRIVVSGVESEKDRLIPILNSGLSFMDLTGQLDLIQLAVLLRKSVLFISNSTGPLHLAVAMGTPVLGFYPSAFDLGPRRWGPFMRPDNQVLTPNDTVAAGSPMESKYDMAKITPEDAFRRIKVLLKEF
jgi:ADP-heptose:LPS heptosyltransferase